MKQCPPSIAAIDAERSVLGAILINPDAIIQVVDILGTSPKVFVDSAHRIIYNGMVGLYQRSTPIDATTLVGALGGDLESVGGVSYLGELMTFVPTSANVAYYAEQVKNSYTARHLTRLFADFSTQLQQKGGAAAVDVLAKAEAELLDLSAKSGDSRILNHISTCLEGAVDSLDRVRNSSDGVTGIPSGIVGLDGVLAGLHAGELVILAARPSVGKTALALAIAQHVAENAQRGVVVFSLEMSGVALAQRMICARGKVDTHRLATGFLGDPEVEKISKTVPLFEKLPLYISQRFMLTPEALRAAARRHAARHDVGLVVVDYLQLMQSEGRRENRQVEVSEISRALKSLAGELSVPVLALSQLSRQAAGDGPPQLSHLRESGAIEQDADAVLFMHRTEQGGGFHHINLIVAKNRNGPLGSIPVVFDATTQRFREGDEKPEQRNSVQYYDGTAEVDYEDEDDELF